MYTTILQKAVQAAQFINNEIANIAAQHPTRFKGVAILPTLNADIMLTEFDRAVNQLNAVGGCFVVSPTAKPPDHSDYLQLYAKAVQLNVPLWMHPSRPATYADYTSDVPQISKYYLFMLLGWILDSSVAMARIVFKGVFDTYPDLKIIAHHKGAITALFQNRLTYGYLIEQNITQNMPTVSQPYVEHFKKFYVDTAFSGNESFETEIVKIAYDFFGADHVVFGTDAPLSTNSGREGTLNARHSVEELRVPNKDIKNIFSNNILKIIPH
jgi:predicted TIM-barrel fold metal-dependent hydrolase